MGSPRVILLASAGSVGLGHLARSTALAQALEMRGAEIVAVALGTDRAIEIDGLRWAPAGELEAIEPGAEVAIGDGYEIQAAELEAVQPQTTFWMHDPSPSASPAAGSDAVPALLLDISGQKGPGRLAGLEFACLRRPYWSRSRRPAARRLERVLVTVGGSDAGGPVGALAAQVAGLMPGCQVSMVRGPQSDSEVPAGVELVDQPATLYPLLSGADLVISAAGQTMLEALCCGAPTIALVRAANQRRQAGIVASAGGALLCEEGDLKAAIASLWAEPARQRLAARGQELVDGLGAHRVAEEILTVLCGQRGFSFGDLRLRDATATDSEFLFELRNDPSAYPSFRSPRPVEPVEHAEWLARTLADPGSDLIVVELDGRAVGNARLHPSATAGNGVEVGISLLAEARGRGVGRDAIAAASALAFLRRGVETVAASVRPGNEASQAAFGAVGFEQRGADAAGFEILILERERFGWGSSRDWKLTR